MSDHIKHDQRAHWHLKNPSVPTYSPLKAQSLNMGYQHGASHTIASGEKNEKNKHCSNSMVWCLRMRHKNKEARKMTEQRAGKKRRKWRNRETGRHAARYIGQECRCHGNRQPSIGIWSSKWNYCRGFDVQYTSGVS